MVVAVEVQADDLVDVVRALRGLEDGKELRKQLRKNITAAAKPMVPAIRAKVKSLPSEGEPVERDRPGLRMSVAKAARLQVQMSGRFAGVTVRIDPKKLPPGMHNLPGYLEGAAPFQRWRHPVYGRGGYATQRPHPYFYVIAERYEGPVKRATAEAIETVRRQIDA